MYGDVANPFLDLKRHPTKNLSSLLKKLRIFFDGRKKLQLKLLSKRNLLCHENVTEIKTSLCFFYFLNSHSKMLFLITEELKGKEWWLCHKGKAISGRLGKVRPENLEVKVPVCALQIKTASSLSLMFWCQFSPSPLFLWTTGTMSVSWKQAQSRFTFLLWSFSASFLQRMNKRYEGFVSQRLGLHSTWCIFEKHEAHCNKKDFENLTRITDFSRKRSSSIHPSGQGH